MKIGILTLPLHINYGGILQAYALYTVLKEMGHEPYLISLKNISQKKTTKEWIKHSLFQVLHWLNSDIVSISSCRELSAIKINVFVRRNIENVLHPVKYEELEFLDAIVVGSDQVWRKEYMGDVRTYFLNFTEGWDIKRVAYAASFGSDKWTYPAELSAQCSTLLTHFNGVSVREKQGVELCEKHFDVNAAHVLDPTLLLKTSKYVAKLIEHKCFLTYILDANEKKTKIINTIEQALNTTEVSNIDKEYLGHNASKVNILRGVDEWLENFASANFVFTDSFHGCVFSIIFNKPFAVALNPQRGNSRFYSLLSDFGLMDRIVSDENEILPLLSQEIDWQSVNEKRHKLKETSISFLQSSLNQEEVS